MTTRVQSAAAVGGGAKQSAYHLNIFTAITRGYLMPIQGSEVSGSNMSMPSVRTKKYSKKSPKNMNGKRKSICGEVQAQLEPVSGIIGTHKSRLGEMKKPGIFSFGESIIEANGDSITSQGHTVDSWDRERKKTCNKGNIWKLSTC